jgi:hypothetical protein
MSDDIRSTAAEFGVSFSEVIRLAVRHGLSHARTELERARD